MQSSWIRNIDCLAVRCSDKAILNLLDNDGYIIIYSLLFYFPWQSSDWSAMSVCIACFIRLIKPLIQPTNNAALHQVVFLFVIRWYVPYVTSPISPRTKWLPFRRRYFQVHFRGCTICILIKIPLTFVFKGPIDKKKQHWFRWLGAELATRHCLDQIYWRIYATLKGDKLRM